MKEKIISIAIDGPASAGKSTVAKEIAKRLSINYIDTGAMYRALTLKVLNENIDIEKPENLKDLLNRTEISFIEGKIILDGKDVSDLIRDNNISNKVSDIAKLKEVRQYMLLSQRRLAKEKSVVMDGRDIGSKVLPEANYKFFITASIDTRAERRYKELLSKGDKSISLEQIKAEIEKRDFIDTSREHSPLVESHDSIRIDTSNLSIEESINKVLKEIREREDVL